MPFYVQFMYVLLPLFRIFYYHICMMIITTLYLKLLCLFFL